MHPDMQSSICPQLRTNGGERDFSDAGRAACNALPVDTRAVSDSVVSRKRLTLTLTLTALSFVLLLTFVDYC